MVARGREVKPSEDSRDPSARSAAILEFSAVRTLGLARLWLGVERYDDSAATSEDFQAVYEEVSGEDLDWFFEIWLWDQVKPPATWTLP